MTAPVTPRQQDVLRFVVGYNYTNGMPPTHREIAEELDISPPTVNEHLNELVDKGLLRREANKSRGYAPVNVCPACRRPMMEVA